MLSATRRFRLLAAVSAALLLVAALAVAGCGGKSKGSDVPPQQRVETALKNAANITSGKSKLDATIAMGSLPGSFKLTGGGPFDTKAEGGAAFDIKLKVNIAGFDQTIGLIAVDGDNYVQIGDKAFKSKQNDPTSGAIDPKSIQALINSLSKYVSDIKQTGTKTVAGQQLDTYSMTIDLGALAKDSLQDNKANNASIPGLGNVADLAKSLGKATATVGIGSDDYPHEIGLNATAGNATDGGSGGGGIRGTLVLTDINKPVTINKPTNIVTDSSALQALGGMLGGLSGGQ
ncbi:MAG: hypothetical protein ACRDKI_05465 [Solirubrobacterales bacterium]